MSKYGNRKTAVDGFIFDSQAEAMRYSELRLAFAAGDILDLDMQVEYEIVVNGSFVCYYLADFVYWDVKTGLQVVEDVKGFKTPVYNLKKKLLKACYGIEIVEVSA